MTSQEAKELALHGHSVSYVAAGSGPVILLVHGIAGNAGQWNPVAEVLSERFTVVAPDLLGHGRSAKPRGDYSLGAYAAWPSWRARMARWATRARGGRSC